MNEERRKFVRHPLSYPLKIKVLHRGDEKGGLHVSKSVNIAKGGLMFHSRREIPEGSEVEIDLEVENRPFVADGTVVRCEKSEKKYSIAVKFRSPHELLKMRMMEQMVRIELVKKRLERRYNKELNFGCVAEKWIERYSKVFARHYNM